MGDRFDRFSTVFKWTMPFCVFYFAFQNCSPVDFSKLQKVEIASIEPIEKKICGELSFVQPNEPKTDQLDLLFVIDTSGSLNDERPLIAQELDAFLLALPSSMKVNISVTLAHGSTSALTGKLYQVTAADPAVLKSEILNIDQLRAGVQNKLSNVVIDNGSDAGEEGLYSLMRLLNGAEFDLAKGQGFFRDQAALAVIFIGDEADICAVDANGNPLAMTSGPGGGVDNEEMAAFNRDCAGVTPQTVYDRLKTVKPDLPLILSSIAYVDAADGEVGSGYIETVDLDNGIKADLGNAMFNADLQEIGVLALERLALIERFSMLDLIDEKDMHEVDWSSLEVTIDDQVVEVQVSEDDAEVVMLESGEPDSVVKASVCTPAFLVDAETGQRVD